MEVFRLMRRDQHQLSADGIFELSPAELREVVGGSFDYHRFFEFRVFRFEAHKAAHHRHGHWDKHHHWHWDD